MSETLVAQNLGGDMVVWSSPTLNELGIANGIGAVPVLGRAGQGAEQWHLGIRSNLKTENYPGQEDDITALNEQGAANAAAWAAGMGFQALARPFKSLGQGQVARLGRTDFEIYEDEAMPIAYTSEATDFVMLNRSDAPDDSGVMYGVADSHTVALVSPDGEAAGIIHGIRGAVANHNIGQRAAAFMSEQSGRNPHELVAAIGPGLQVECHKIGTRAVGTALPVPIEAIASNIQAGNLPENALRETVDENGLVTYRFDALAALKHQLHAAGVGEIVWSEDCTAALPSVGHTELAEYPFPSLRRANELNQEVAIVDGRVLPLTGAGGADKVSRYPAMVGWRV